MVAAEARKGKRESAHEREHAVFRMHILLPQASEQVPLPSPFKSKRPRNRHECLGPFVVPPDGSLTIHPSKVITVLVLYRDQILAHPLWWPLEAPECDVTTD